MLALATPVALAHHGFTGVYDFDRPLYTEGRVLAARYAYPHAQVELDLAGTKGAMDLAGLEPIERAEGRETLKRVRPLDRPGRVAILLDPILTRALIDNAAQQPRVGDRVRAIVYERVSDDAQRGELRVMLLTLRDGTAIVTGRRSFHQEGARKGG